MIPRNKLTDYNDYEGYSLDREEDIDEQEEDIRDEYDEPEIELNEPIC